MANLFSFEYNLENRYSNQMETCSMDYWDRQDIHSDYSNQKIPFRMKEAHLNILKKVAAIIYVMPTCHLYLEICVWNK